MKKREHGTKDTVSDIDDMTAEERAEQLEDLSLRDISDRKLRKVLRDLDVQLAQLPQDSQSQKIEHSQAK